MITSQCLFQQYRTCKPLLVQWERKHILTPSNVLRIVAPCGPTPCRSIEPSSLTIRTELT